MSRHLNVGRESVACDTQTKRLGAQDSLNSSSQRIGESSSCPLRSMCPRDYAQGGNILGIVLARNAGRRKRANTLEISLRAEVAGVAPRPTLAGNPKRASGSVAARGSRSSVKTHSEGPGFSEFPATILSDRTNSQKLAVGDDPRNHSPKAHRLNDVQPFTDS